MYCFIGLSFALSYSNNIHGIPAKIAFAVIKMLKCLLSSSMLWHFFLLGIDLEGDTSTKFSGTDLSSSLSKSSWCNILLQAEPQPHF